MRNKIVISLIFIINSLILFAQESTETRLSKIDYSKPKEYEIGGITISGIQYLDQNVLVSMSGLQVGKTIMVPGDAITNAINKLWKHGLFGDIEISATKVIDNKIFLDIYLKERPRLSKFNFVGVSKSQADDLRDEIKLTRGSQVTDDVISLTTRKVNEFFIKKGFLDVETNIVQAEDTIMPNTVILTINVNKNNRIKINDIVFEGNEVLKKGKLHRAMKETKRKRWYNLFKSSKYIESNFEKDKNSIIAKYNEKGYRDATITSDSVYHYDKKTLNIEMRISEGKQYFFRNIEWVGNTKYPSEVLNQELRIKKGDVFDQSILDKRLNGEEDAVSALYLDRGYLFFSAMPVEVQAENDSIDLEIRIYEGKQARVNKVTITGNTRTNEHVIRREIWTRPGDLFSRSDIIRTNRELSNLGYFNPEKMDVRPVPNPSDGTVDLEYIVEEKPSDQIELSGGWGGGMIIGTLGLTFSNFSMRNILDLDSYSPLPTGDGQKFSIRGQTSGKYYRSFSMSFTEPWLGGRKPNSLTLSLYHTVRSSGSSVYSKNINKYMKITGASVGLGRRLEWPDNYFTLYNELTYQRYNIFNYPVLEQFSTGKANNINFTTVISRNSVDQPLYPRRGANISLSLSLTPPYSMFKDEDFWLLNQAEKSALGNDASKINDAEQANKYKFIEYHKWKFKADWYNQLMDKLVLRTNFEFGYLGYYSSNLGYSPFESFQLGGDGMQGYNYYYGYDVIPLRGYDNGSNNNGSLTSYPQANVYNKLSIELRYPITLSSSATIYGLVFMDAGNTCYHIEEFSPFSLYRSAGVGVRFWLPMFGLLGLDWGYGFDTPSWPNETGSNKSQFAFTIGQQF
jgi:outer membrane protein insertion porin family